METTYCKFTGSYVCGYREFSVTMVGVYTRFLQEVREINV